MNRKIRLLTIAALAAELDPLKFRITSFVMPALPALLVPLNVTNPAVFEMMLLPAVLEFVKSTWPPFLATMALPAVLEPEN